MLNEWATDTALELSYHKLPASWLSTLDGKLYLSPLTWYQAQSRLIHFSLNGQVSEESKEWITI